MDGNPSVSRNRNETVGLYWAIGPWPSIRVTHITVEREGHNVNLRALADGFDRRDWQETTVLVSGDREKATEVATSAETVEHALTFEEFHNGDARDAYDAVYIVTPNARHLPFVETAATFEKEILCEKPMEATIARAERVVDICDEHDVTLMVAYRMHTEPAVRRAKDLIDQGVIGDPLFIHGNMTEPILELVPNPDQWRLDSELSGGCAVMDIGLYPLNTSRFLLEEDPVRVRGTVASVHEAFEDVPENTARSSSTSRITCTQSVRPAKTRTQRVTSPFSGPTAASEWNQRSIRGMTAN